MKPPLSRSEAICFRAAQKLGAVGFAPAKFNHLPGDVRFLIESARKELEECIGLRKRIQDPKLRETQQALSELDKGNLTKYQLRSDSVLAANRNTELDLKPMPENAKTRGWQGVKIDRASENGFSGLMIVEPPQVFVSYAWGDLSPNATEEDRQRQEVVERLCRKLEQERWNDRSAIA